MNNVEKSLSKAIERFMYGPMDVITATLCHKGFCQKDNTSASFDSCILGAAEDLRECLQLGRHPTLNPVIDKIYEFKNEDNSGLEAIKLFIENKSEIKREQLDNDNDIVILNIPVEILMVNAPPFVKSKKIEILKASVQTPLFRKEIS